MIIQCNDKFTYEVFSGLQWIQITIVHANPCYTVYKGREREGGVCVQREREGGGGVCVQREGEHLAG